MPKTSPLSNLGTTRVFLCIINGRRNPKAIADFLRIKPPPVIQQLRRLQSIGIIGLGKKEGKEQNYEIDWDNFLALFIERAIQKRGSKKPGERDIIVENNIRSNYDKVKTLKDNRYFRKMVQLYLQNISESNPSTWISIERAIGNFEIALQRSHSFKRSRKFEDSEKQDFFNKMRAWYNQVLSVHTWMDLNLHDAITNTLRRKANSYVPSIPSAQ